MEKIAGIRDDIFKLLFRLVQLIQEPNTKSFLHKLNKFSTVSRCDLMEPITNSRLAYGDCHWKLPKRR